MLLGQRVTPSQSTVPTDRPGANTEITELHWPYLFGIVQMIPDRATCRCREAVLKLSVSALENGTAEQTAERSQGEGW
jgi:hypothetical protein